MPSDHPVSAPGAEVPLSVPEIRGNEWRYLKECLDTNFVSSVGPFVGRFERMVADYLGASHAVATVNGTAALHLALLGVGVQADEEVVVSALTFIAPVNAIRYVGAWPVFVDAEPDHWQMDPRKLVDFLEDQCHWQDGHLRNRKTGRRVRAVLPVHILGHPVDIDPIVEAARRFDLKVVEDASESFGARYRGRAISPTGDVGCLSFNGNKLITTGGGGMLVTNRHEVADRTRYLSTQAKDDPIAFVHGEVGFNYRLTNIQAAIGVAQLERIEEFIATKRAIAANYTEAFRTIDGVYPMAEAPWASSAFWMYTIRVDETRYGINARDLIQGLGERGIQARPLWQAINQSPAHRASAISCPVAERLARSTVSLPCSVGLTQSQQDAVISAVATRVGPTRSSWWPENS